MKKTFMGREVIMLLNLDHFKFLYNYAIKSGLEWWDSSENFVPTEDYMSEWPLFCVDESLVLTNAKSYYEYSEIINTEIFMRYCDNWKEHRSVILRLTNDYNACIDKQGKNVKVGCQTITFDKIEELYKLMHS